MNSTVKKRSIVIGGRRTSVSLEDDFWMSLRQIARGRQVTTSDLIAPLDAARESNLSSAIRVFILDHYRAMASQSDVAFTPLSVIPQAVVTGNPTAMALTSRPAGGASPPATGA
jgi:predicted DNA-binding ribbon-helix-helix protein